MITTSHFHPLAVHFPIALILVAFLFDLIALVIKKEPCLSRTGYWLEILGMASAIVAFGTGYFFTSQMDGETGVMRDKHEFFATVTLISIILATLFRIVIVYLDKQNTRLNYLALGLLFISVIFVSVTGFLGGSLVIDYMIGL